MHWPSIRIPTSRASLFYDESAALIASKIVGFPNDRTLSSESPVLVPSALTLTLVLASRPVALA